MNAESRRKRSTGWAAAILVAALLAAGCASPPTGSSPISVDVLDFLVGDPSLWPRHGDQNQHQVLEPPGRICWTKYTLGWSFECWRWDDSWIYHEVDHAIDGNRWQHYGFSDGRWLPRRLGVGSVWELNVADNRIRWVDAACKPEPERAFPYRVRAWVEPQFDAGGDLGRREVVVLEYQVDPGHADPRSAERFYLARNAGWFLWTRADGVRVAFNRIGGVPRMRTPLCASDFEAETGLPAW